MSYEEHISDNSVYKSEKLKQQQDQSENDRTGAWDVAFIELGMFLLCAILLGYGE